MSIYCGSAAVNAIKYCDADGDVQDVAYVKRNNAIVWGEEPQPVVPYGGLKFTANTAGSTVAMQAVGSAPSVTLLTSTDGANWSEFTVGTTTITLANAGDYVYFKAGASGNTAMGSSASNYNKFVMTGSVAASGNIQSLLDASLERMDVSASCYYYMFYGCTALTTAPSLPATTLAQSCYFSMFHNCTALTTAPSLPATTLARSCYNRMFYGCTALTTAPSLPATTLEAYCYYYMFYGCTALTTAPSLSATTLAENCCYYMFASCDALKISENGGVGTIVLNVPSGTTEYSNWNANMFSYTGGTFTGWPSVGVPYYCYQ